MVVALLLFCMNQLELLAYVEVKICLYFSDKLTLNTKKRLLATVHKKRQNQILMKLEREPDSDEIEEMEEEVEEYAVTDPLSSSNSLQVFLGRLALLNKWHASYILSNTYS